MARVGNAIVYFSHQATLRYNRLPQEDKKKVFALEVETTPKECNQISQKHFDITLQVRYDMSPDGSLISEMFVYWKQPASPLLVPGEQKWVEWWCLPLLVGFSGHLTGHCAGQGDPFGSSYAYPYEDLHNA